MINTLDLKNYRGFKQYQLSGLSRVNLLVGKNNSGKSSILEAVHLLAATGDPRVLSRIAWQRGEVVAITPTEDAAATDLFPNILHAFFGHDLSEDATLSIASNNAKLSYKLVPIADADEPQQALIFEDAAKVRRQYRAEVSNIRLTYALRIEGTNVPGSSVVFPVTDEGALLVDASRNLNRAATSRWRRDEGDAVLFITPESLTNNAMSELWDKAITERRETDVIAALRILEPTLKNLFFLSGERAYRYGGRGGVLVDFEAAPKRLPLGSYGEGMRRLLALALSLARPKGGVLLIDEMDTGLHYSIMGDIWVMILKAAIQNDVQVFATTHSLDCVRGLGWLCEHHPDLGEQVSLQKIDRNLDEAVGLDASKLKLAVELEQEMR
jgi:predicted ATPase